MLGDQGQDEKAIATLEKYLPSRPNARGYYSYALTLLTGGRLVEGWRHLESRWLMEPFLSVRARFPEPVWAGQDLRSATILLRAEQGIGDTIQFVRYAPIAQGAGSHRCHSGARRTPAARVEGLPASIGCFPAGEPTPAFDYYIHPLSLPNVFRTDVASIPTLDSLRRGPAGATE